MQNLNHERHVPHPVHPHNGRRISHPHRITMNNFSYPDICVWGRREICRKNTVKQNGKKMTDQQ
jgi:hypothetical protein